jgi:hypothetical protein
MDMAAAKANSGSHMRMRRVVSEDVKVRTCVSVVSYSCLCVFMCNYTYMYVCTFRNYMHIEW